MLAAITSDFRRPRTSIMIMVHAVIMDQPQHYWPQSPRILPQTPYFPELETPAEVGHRAMDCAGHVARCIEDPQHCRRLIEDPQ